MKAGASGPLSSSANSTGEPFVPAAYLHLSLDVGATVTLKGVADVYAAIPDAYRKATNDMLIVHAEKHSLTASVIEMLCTFVKSQVQPMLLSNSVSLDDRRTQLRKITPELWAKYQATVQESTVEEDVAGVV